MQAIKPGNITRRRYVNESKLDNLGHTTNNHIVRITKGANMNDILNQSRVLQVLRLLHEENTDAEYCSPNFVAKFAAEHNITLNSRQVVVISHVFGAPNDPTQGATK